MSTYDLQILQYSMLLSSREFKRTQERQRGQCVRAILLSIMSLAITHASEKLMRPNGYDFL